ncbi:RND transporter [Pseudomonas aeruginosa]|nr:RND transporter [Pseudomonas aeruginosa]
MGLVGCTQVPKAPLPVVPAATAYKGGAVAAPGAGALERDRWWTLYQDEELTRLQQLLVQHSPDLASALARYRQAQAVTDTLRADRLPSVNAVLDGTRNRQSERRPLRGADSPNFYDNGLLGLNVAYELDLWGRISQQVAAGMADEEAAQADLEAARLALQVQLADRLVALRGADREITLLRDTVAAYERAARMLFERHRTGIASGLDLAQAQAQVEVASSQLHQIQAQRALLENAIAGLVGENASTFIVQPQLESVEVPSIPTGLPSELLQRRADIVAAQRRVVAANASVGVARKAYFPSVRLSAVVGYQSDDFGNLTSAPNLFWAVGPELLLNVFDGGRRHAEIERAEAVLDEAGQNYRGVVLAAFQQVEDQLALLDEYATAATFENQAVVATQRALDLANNRYRDGAASYLDVVTAQTANLQSQRSALDLKTRQRRASVQLVKALGGGWSDTMTAAYAE